MSSRGLHPCAPHRRKSSSSSLRRFHRIGRGSLVPFHIAGWSIDRWDTISWGQTWFSSLEVKLGSWFFGAAPDRARNQKPSLTPGKKTSLTPGKKPSLTPGNHGEVGSRLAGRKVGAEQ